MTDFIHLHVHSEYSLLDGACRIKQLVRRAKAMGQTAVAITDHGCMYGAVDFFEAAKAEGIKPIIGCEVYVAPRTRFDKAHGLDNKPYHLVLLCKNDEGYRNLIKLVSIGYTEGFYSKPRVDKEILRKYSGGLIALSACLAGEVARRLSEDDYDAARAAAAEYRDIFGEGNFYIEVQNHGLEEQLKILPYQYRLSRETGIPLAATNDAHYIEKADAAVQRVLLAIQTKTTLDQPNGMGFATDEFYLKSGDEMAELFRSEPSAIENTVKIAEQCNFSFEFGVTKLPKFELEGVSDNSAYLREICYQGLERKYGDNTAARERLEYELSVVEKMGYVDYYLIVWDFIRYAKENDIPVGPGRGSGAGSIAAYCIGITGIDPLRYNLLFERFLNPERVSMPDFDIDFCIEGRPRVINYVISRYGEDRVAQIITFGTMAAKGVVRDVGRVMGIPYDTCDKVAKMIPRDSDITIDEAMEQVDEFRELYERDVTIKRLIDMAKRIEGMPRNASTHAAGVVIASAPVRDFVPVQKNDESVITQYTMNNLAQLGLLKIDFLGLRNLTIIRNCSRLIRRYEPDFDILNISLDDKEVFEMLSRGETDGVFQFESAGMRSVLTRLQPVSIEDLIAVVSLHRPGPMESIPRYIANRHNPKLVTYKHPLLKGILDVTYGCIVYQEQVMQIFRVLAGYSYGRADIVRRAMAKKKVDAMERERQSFIYGDKNPDGSVNCVGAVVNGVPVEVATDIFDEMMSFAEYAFNKSHAAAYAYVAYWTAYLKCHYYREYMAALMTGVLGETGKLTEYIAEVRTRGYKVEPPHINESADVVTVTDDGIRLGLMALKGMGQAVAADIISERESGGKYRSFQNFCSRMGGRNINKRAVEGLIKCGAVDNLGLNRRQMLENYERIMGNMSEQVKNNLDGQMSLFGFDDYIEEVPFVEEFPADELMKMEKEIFGFYFSGSPVERYAGIRTASKCLKIATIISSAKEGLKGFGDNDSVIFFGNVTSKKLHTTKNGSAMCFMSAEDETGDIEGILFPKIFDMVGRLIEKDVILIFAGRLSLKENEDAKVIVEQVYTTEQFCSIQLKRSVCIRCLSTDSAVINGAVKILSEEYGSSKLNFYFRDNDKFCGYNKMSGGKMTEKRLKRLMDLAGVENVLFMD